MKDIIELFNTGKIPCFGVAGNFTGHLEQAGEAADFKSMAVSDAAAPKAVFPTFIPGKSKSEESKNVGSKKTVPEFLHTFPFDAEKIIFPLNEEKLQIEPECALIFRAEWEDKKIRSLSLVVFGASNDCSIRKAGAKKISEKKNWGKSSKGFSKNLIESGTFAPGGILDKYRIASFLVRDGVAHQYGEDSAVRDYSYIYARLENWLIEKLNAQKDEGPAENIGSYLSECGYPEYIMISIGATRYTEYGEHNFLQAGDFSVVVLYPEDKYTHSDIEAFVKNQNFSKEDISFLVQEIKLT